MPASPSESKTGGERLSPVLRFASRRGGVLSLVLSLNDSTLYSSDGGGSVRMWDASFGRHIADLPKGRSPARALAVDAANETLYAGDDKGNLTAWDTGARMRPRTLTAGTSRRT